MTAGSRMVFAFSGTEVVGVAAGETKDPAQAIPKAVHTTVLRLAIFFIGSIAVMSALIPWHQSGVDTSPFVLVFQSIGMPFAGDVMNFVVLTAVLSAANSGLYGLVACAGGYDSARARQDEFSWCARVRGALQYGRIVVGVAVFCGCRFDGVFGVGCGFRLGHAGGVGVGFRLPLAFPQAVACSRPFG